VQIKNFRQYRGTHKIDLHSDPDKNVVVIKGKNGAGKSNLLNAITWCLYDLEAHKENDIHDEHGMPIINAAELESSVTGQPVTAEVIISLDSERGTWLIQRQIEGRKDDQGRLSIQPKSELTVIHPRGNQNIVEKGDDTQIYINNLLPEALRSFFFIDGEQLREFFRVSTPTKVAKAIDIVSQLALLYNAADHLTHYQNSVRKNLKNTTPKLKTLQQEIKSLQDRILETDEAIQKGNTKIKSYNSELQDLQNYLKNYNVGQISHLQNERESVQEDITLYKKQIFNLESERNSYLVKIAPLIYLKETIKKAYDIMNEKVDKGELPSRIKETFVRELLDRGTCICGNDLTGDSRRTLEKYSERLTLSELSDITMMGRNEFDEVFGLIKDFPEKMDSFNQKIEELNQGLESKELRKVRIGEEIIENDAEEIRRKESLRSDLEKKIGGIERVIKISKSDLNTLRTNLDSKKKEEDRELSIDEKNKSLRPKLQLVDNALTVLADAEQIIKTKIMEQVESNTQTNFQTLIRKKSAFTKISIDENYSVTLQDTYGYNVINDLSAGEYLILGLSFMSALMSISGYHTPVIIDTPLGKIDDEHREYITTELPKLLKGTQLILLVTPTEYDEKVRNNLSQYLSEDNYYEICENVNNTESKVVGTNVSRT
jgi:DNA sulfur modification protein DndD